MLEGLKDALEHVEDLARENEKTEVVEICGHTYANKTLKRYDTENYAEPVKAAAPVEFGEKWILALMKREWPG